MSSLIPIIIITLGCWIVCNAKIQYEVEGQNAQLAFPYSCESTKVTLRHGYKEPFYDSTDLESPSPARYLLNNQNDTARNECSVQLTINPISRNDEGTFGLTAYKNGIMLPDYPRIGLRVAYPPGKASCELSNDYDDEEWVSLRCTASVGTMPGQITCYQNDLKLPKLNLWDVNHGETFSQTILVRRTGFVYCCSSVIDYIQDRCECKDYLWDPLQNGPMHMYDIHVPEPCPGSTFLYDTTQGSTQNSNAPLEKITYMNMYPPTSLQANNTLNLETGNSGNSKELYIVIGILILVVLFFLVFNFIQWKQNSNFNCHAATQEDDYNEEYDHNVENERVHIIIE